MGRARVRAALGVVASVVLATVLACSDLEGLSGTGEDAGGDATIDGSSGPPPEGSVDATADAPGSSSFCATRDATFCDDFDDGLVAGRWTFTFVRGGGLVSITDAGASGSRGALHAKIDAEAGLDAGHAAQLAKRLTGPATKMTCSAAVYVEAQTAKTGAFFIGTPHATGWMGCGLDIKATTDGVFWVAGDLPDGGRYGDDEVVGILPSGQWFDVVIETDFATATMAINGTKSPPLTLPAVSRTAYEVFVGADFDKDQAGSASLRIDNVVCDVTP